MKQAEFGFAERPPDDGPLSCRLSVAPGNGRNRPKRGKEGPVRDFLVDQDSYYREVFNHVRECRAGCTPDLVLEKYLERRASVRKFKGETSSGLCDLAERYERIGASPALVRQFFIRSADAALLGSRPDLSPKELVDGVRFIFAKWHRDWKEIESNLPAGSPAFQNFLNFRRNSKGAVGALILVAVEAFENKRPLPPDEELLRLAEVAAVMSS